MAASPVSLLLFSTAYRYYSEVTMVKVAVMLADGVEESEAIVVIDLLRRSSDIFSVMTFSIMGHKEIHSSHGITFMADELFDQNVISGYDMIFLPGGGVGTKNLNAFMPLRAMLQQFAKDGKTLAAICAAPFVLYSAGVLAGKSFTCYPGFEDKIDNGGSFRPDLPVVQDGEIFTSRGMGTAIDLGLALTMRFGGTTAAWKMYDQIVYMNTDYRNRID